jgi:hypothetical protein
MSISKNCTVGKTTGVTVIEMGKGDVSVASVESTSIIHPKVFGISLKNIPSLPLGTLLPDKGKSLDETGVDVLIYFHNKASLEVFQRSLDHVRENLNENKVKFKIRKCRKLCAFYKKNFNNSLHYCTIKDTGCNGVKNCPKFSIIIK